jgi:hypothetical protein
MTVENKERFMEYANKVIKEKKPKAKINDDNVADYNVVKSWKFRQIRGYKQ